MEIPAPDYVLPTGFDLVYSGKVRDLWTTPAGELLFVASNRVSAYDHIIPTPIPDKGSILTAVSVWWFERMADVVPNHLISLDVPAAVAGRAMICERLEMVPVECVARGYLAGSGLRDYENTGGVCGVPLPAGLVDGSKLPEAIFTPATKADLGDHDENIDFDAVIREVGDTQAKELRRLTLSIYTRAEGIARSRGLILADTKFEFGVRVADRSQLVLADEVLTPDSSRWWPIESWHPGQPQPSFDKQYVRDWLTSPESGWDKDSGREPPELPDAVAGQTRRKYIDAYERLTGQIWE
ncbi:MAG: phosphoribosylaminoimidazole-succinocarboxamide synthase [Actinomycetes bacterium]